MINIKKLKNSFKNPPKKNEFIYGEKLMILIFSIIGVPMLLFAFYIPLFLQGESYFYARYLLIIYTTLFTVILFVMPLFTTILIWKRLHIVRRIAYIAFSLIIFLVGYKDVIRLYYDINYFNQHGAEVIEGTVIKSSDGVRGAYYNIYLDNFEGSLTGGWGPNLDVDVEYRIYYLPNTREIISAISPGQRYGFEQ